MKNKLILLDGHSTVGKSSISKSVFEQLLMNSSDREENVYQNQYIGNAEFVWIHEECDKHPIRESEINMADIHTAEGMEINRKELLTRWKRLAKEITKSEKIYVMEGCLLHMMDRFLLESVWNSEQIEEFYLQIIKIIEHLNPFIIFLYRPDIQKSFEEAFEARGDWWRELVLGEPEPYGYFENHVYSGKDSIFAGINYEQNEMFNIYDLLPCRKMKLDTSFKDWRKYTAEIIEAMGYQYAEVTEQVFIPSDYIGTYTLLNSEDTWKIGYDETAKSMYISIFWPYMPIQYCGQNAFTMISFPVKIQFDSDLQSFKVSGNYEWEYNGKRFLRT